MYYALLAFVFAVMGEIICVPLINLKYSDNLQNSSNILEMLDTFDVLNSIQFLCRKNESIKGTDELIYYCQELIKENGNYLSLKYIIETKINEIRYSLVKLLNLENKAVVCRGMRYLLPIIIYAIFINNTINGSTENGNSVIDTFDQLLKKKMDLLNDKNTSIEKKLQQIKAPMTKNDERNKKLGEKPEQSKGEFAETSSSFIEKIITIVQLILPFIKKRDCFHNLYKIVTIISKFDHNLWLLLIFDEVKNMYKTECYAVIDAATLMQNKDGRWKFERKYDSIPMLVGEIDRLSLSIHKDLQLLFVKFFFANNPQRPLEQCPDVSMVFYHTLNKYYDPKVWKLIGNETIVDRSFDSAESVAMSINKVASNLVKKIQSTTDELTTLIKKTVQCRCYEYLNLMIKLFYCSVHVLATNMREVGRSARVLAVEELQRIEQDKVYSLLHNEIKGLWTAECFIGNDVDTIDELLDRDGGDKYFRSAYAVYWNRNARSVGRMIETISDLLDPNLVAEFGPMLQDIHQIQIQPKTDMKSVKSLVNRYKRGERAYKDYCFPDECDGNLFTFSDNMKWALQATTDNTTIKPTLGLIMTMTDTLNDDLEDDLEIINQKFQYV